MTEKLLPCPFCGGEATISDGGYSGEKFLARCRDLSCPAASGFIRKTHDEAIAAWNRRSDAVPVVRGEWIEAKSGVMSVWPPGQVMCSVCGQRMPLAWKKMPPYCYGCGAKMESEGLNV